MRVRFRVDGELVRIAEPLGASMISRLKVLAKPTSPSGVRTSRDASSCAHDGEEIDIRASFYDRPRRERGLRSLRKTRCAWPAGHGLSRDAARSTPSSRAAACCS
jgi:hypothetical protein